MPNARLAAGNFDRQKLPVPTYLNALRFFPCAFRMLTLSKLSPVKFLAHSVL